jgi:hypothetical protein
MFIRGQVIAFDGNVHKGKLRRARIIKGESTGGGAGLMNAGFWTFIECERTENECGSQSGWDVRDNYK